MPQTQILFARHEAPGRSRPPVDQEASTTVNLEPASAAAAADAQCLQQAPFTLCHHKRIGRYVVLEYVGHGGMGVVYQARDPRLDRVVALKLLTRRGDPVNPRGRDPRALLREAQALAKVAHPNVVSVFDAGMADDEVFLAMEFVEGLTLKQWVIKRRPTLTEILAAFVEAGRGLAAVHQAGLTHGDFKPNNAIMGDDGRVRIVDFGLARPRGQTNDHQAIFFGADMVVPLGLGAMSEQRSGTPAYMAPEQLRGEGSDERADQYGYCVALYEALYGERPFAGTSLSERADDNHEAVVGQPPKGRRVPEWLRRVILRGLAGDPAERFPSMEALLALLHKSDGSGRRYLGGAP